MPARNIAQKIGVVAVRVAIALAVIAVVTAGSFFIGHLNATTAGFGYIVAVLLIATFLGGVESVTACFAAAACFNFFFLPPVFTFSIAEPQNWTALVALLTTALVASRLAERARDQTQEALDRRQEMELLYALSRAILLSDPAESTASRITLEVARIFSFSSVKLFDARSGQMHVAGPDDFPDDVGGGNHTLDRDIRESAMNGTSFDRIGQGLRIVAVRLGGQPIGGLALRPVTVSETALQSITNLVAVTLEKVHGQELSNRMEAERQSEILKSTLMDAIAHEFKTPLTSIKAAASALLLNPLAAPERIRELGTIVDEESDRLGRLVTEATQMSRIEGGETRLNREWISSETVTQEAVAQCRSALDGHEVSIAIEPDGGKMFADPELIGIALRHLLDNAAKYSGGSLPIGIRVAPGEDGILVEVRDQGPGIPQSEQARVFDKFYRAPQTQVSTPGTGMGLSIVREIVRAHGGRVWVESRPEEGARFSLFLPNSPSAE